MSGETAQSEARVFYDRSARRARAGGCTGGLLSRQEVMPVRTIEIEQNNHMSLALRDAAHEEEGLGLYRLATYRPSISRERNVRLRGN